METARKADCIGPFGNEDIRRGHRSMKVLGREFATASNILVSSMGTARIYVGSCYTLRDFISTSKVTHNPCCVLEDIWVPRVCMKE